MRRVAVTGIGVVAPNGVGTEEFWESTREGRSGISQVESFDSSGHTVKVGGEVKNWDPSPYLNGNRKSLKVMGRNVQFGIAASKMAMENSGLYGDSSIDPTRFGVVMGTGMIPMDVSEFSSAVSQATNGSFSLPKFAKLEQAEMQPLWI